MVGVFDEAEFPAVGAPLFKQGVDDHGGLEAFRLVDGHDAHGLHAFGHGHLFLAAVFLPLGKKVGKGDDALGRAGADNFKEALQEGRGFLKAAEHVLVPVPLAEDVIDGHDRKAPEEGSDVLLKNPGMGRAPEFVQRNGRPGIVLLSGMSAVFVREEADDVIVEIAAGDAFPVREAVGKDAARDHGPEGCVVLGIEQEGEEGLGLHDEGVIPDEKAVFRDNGNIFR